MQGKSEYENSVGPGWRHIVMPLVAYCKEHNIEIQQIKEKFGWLRFYYKGDDPAFKELVQKAEERSAQTCEWCGDSGERRATSWIKVLCDKHYDLWHNKDTRWWEPSRFEHHTKGE